MTTDDTQIWPGLTDHSRWYSTDSDRIHYIDSGTGRPVLFLHGNPTWGFLYRRLIHNLSEDHRCIAPDWPGFGYSDVSNDGALSPSDCVPLLRSLIDDLDLGTVDLVVHDWGGPIGLRYLAEHPDHVGNLVVFNSWAGVADQSVTTRYFSGVMSSFLGHPIEWSGRLLVPFMIFGVHRRLSFLRNALPAYWQANPHGPTVRRWSRALTAETEWLRGTRSHALSLNGDHDLLMFWGTRDPVLPSSMIDQWTSLFPKHTVHTLPDASHFVTEDIGDEYNDEIKAFLG